MIYFYDTNQFDQWYQDFQKITKCNIPSDKISIIRHWVNDETPLSSVFNMENYSVSAECSSLSDDIIIKTSKVSMMQYLERKYNNFPILEKYTIPTFVYSLPRPHSLDQVHIDYLGKLYHNVGRYSDCLILQQKCKIFEKELSEDYWEGKRSCLYSDTVFCAG